MKLISESLCLQYVNLQYLFNGAKSKGSEKLLPFSLRPKSNYNPGNIAKTLNDRLSDRFVYDIGIKGVFKPRAFFGPARRDWDIWSNPFLHRTAASKI